ncbi:MAG: hypothetical protein GX345_01255 [Clostridiales bacterium]|nr:hypothetical protein [Clostridiales bacterium]
MQANICPLSPDGKTGVDGFVVVGALVVVVFVVVCALVVVGFVVVGALVVVVFVVVGALVVVGFVVVGALVVVGFVVVCALVVVGFMLVGSVLLGFVEAFASVETALSLVPSWLEGVDETSVVPSACVWVRLSKAFASCMVVLLE